MGEFNFDDPLAGILSDGSDDSFFDDDVLGKKKVMRKKSIPVTEMKNALFNLEENENSKTASSAIKINTENVTNKLSTGKAKSPTPTASPVQFNRTYSKESLKFQQELDAKSKSSLEMIDLVKSPIKGKTTNTEKTNKLTDSNDNIRTKKPVEKGKSSQSLLDDILGGSSSIKPSTSMSVTKSQEFDLESFLGKSESKPKIKSSLHTEGENRKSTNPVKTNKKETSQDNKKSDANWLGLFQEDTNEEADNDADMPSWLGGNQTKKKKAPERDKNVPTQDKIVKEVPKDEMAVDKDANENHIIDMAKEIQGTGTSSQTFTKLAQGIGSLNHSNEDVTTETAALYLQQQESQLMVALQLKAQDEKLAALQMRQKESQRVQRDAAQAHRAQVDAMLRRQAGHRQQMQEIIATHQERITQRIKNLLGTPEGDDDGNALFDEERQEPAITEKESPLTKEKRQLLQLVQSLQENHDKEIDLMETSYRKQLAFLEVSLNQTEDRMKEESEKLVKFFTEKIGWLEEHHQSFKKLAQENLNVLSDRYKAENEMLRLQHLDNVKILQEHHAALVENIKNAVKTEQTLIRDSAGFSNDLHELVKDVKENKSHCQQLVEKVKELTENTNTENERSLQTRETQINDMILQLKKDRDNFENEKTETREMVRLLEGRLKQMTAMVEEESAILKQKRMDFEFEKATFNKQTEFAKNVLKRQDEEIKMLREDIEKEYKEKMAKIEDEKIKVQKDTTTVAKEKVSIQSLKQELEKIKTELQIQLEAVTEERSRINLEKQQIQMEEQRILAKSRDLDLLAKTAIDKQSQADKKLSEADFIQKKYEERIRRIQEHVVSLNSREKHIAKEKVALSRERLNLHNERKKLESRQSCSLCRNQEMPHYFEPNLEEYTNVSVSRDYSGNVNSAMNAIESEMAYLMGRNFSLRHDDKIREQGKEYIQKTENLKEEPGMFKDLMDPRFMMLRLDVQQVLNNLDQSKKDDFGATEITSENREN